MARRRFAADLHVHSYLARACSPLLRPEPLHRWAQLKGLAVLATGDATHPRWRAELKAKLVESAEPGFLELKPALARLADKDVPSSCRAPVRFVLASEIACIYKKDGKVRRQHHLVYLPGWSELERLCARLEAEGANLSSDGRPITGLDSRRLLELVLETSPRAHLVPAHAWTPHFGLLGSESGFDSLEQCFGDLAERVFAVETGLSSDPAMNRRLSGLDRVALMSNSDAHSPDKLGREANLFDGPFSYDGIFESVRRRDKAFRGTLEFFPEEGKYHADGHRACGARLSPAETRAAGGRCPGCGGPVTVGVLSRVEALADRAAGGLTDRCEHVVPLKELLGEVLGVGPASMKVARLYQELLARFGPELSVLRELKPRAVAEAGQPLLALALARMRAGQALLEPGYDGVYGRVRFLSAEDRASSGQLALA